MFLLPNHCNVISDDLQEFQPTGATDIFKVPLKVK